MPHLIHHRRRHSWPYSNGEARLRGRRNLPLPRVSEPQNPFEQQFLTPLVSGDFPEDDAASAGIIRSKTARPHRLWPHSSSRETVASGTSGQYPTTGAGSGGGSLRRMIRPPLDKARSLFMVPTTTTAGENVVISFWVPRQSGVQQLPPAAPGRVLGDDLQRLSASYGIPRVVAPSAQHTMCAREHEHTTTTTTTNTTSKRSSGSFHPRRSGDDYRRYSGTVNHYGRHSNDWLFGGFSLRDTVRDRVDRLRGHGEKS
ncbi:uncharacterized protein ATNIH1004_008259 [Aspergillus tanneri]|uniref:Uncharacterized protein n=1 Tax=Aspergillus tanneri TaxID=1220188 RepID=A0A5M9MAI5_9EURO|nr:uncharacterized protein ATNIH1004_008259 [Aspergillus tanneri]KAA8644062.1 hypothetical protein ATNIH1004_008259 [Aspergillus tanneri]